jgi:hypothetical protein
MSTCEPIIEHDEWVFWSRNSPTRGRAERKRGIKIYVVSGIVWLRRCAAREAMTHFKDGVVVFVDAIRKLMCPAGSIPNGFVN